MEINVNTTYPFDETIAVLKENNNFVQMGDLGITINGVLIETMLFDETEEGISQIRVFAGNPMDEFDEEWVEIIPSTEELTDILNDFLELF